MCFFILGVKKEPLVNSALSTENINNLYGYPDIPKLNLRIHLKRCDDVLWNI